MTILITLLLLLIVADYSQCKQEETTESQFKKWFTSNGGVIKAIEIYDFEHMGRGFMATQDIVSETEILKIPANLIFSTQSMKSSNDAGLLTLLRRFDPEVALKAWLLLEAVEGETSFFYEYISILPKTIPSLLGFPEELCAELQDTEFIGEVKTFQERVKSEYASFSTKFRQLYPALNVSFADYSWATAVLDSRGLRFRGEVYLAPMADMFNYAPHSDARAANSGNFFLQHHILESDGGIRILADRDTANGMQLFEDYGDNTDDIYLKYHGFVAEGNPFRCIRLDSSVLSSSAYTYVNGKSDLLRELEFKKAPRKCMDQTGALSKGLEVYLTVLAFNDGEASQCRALTKKHPQKWPKIFRDCKFESISNFVANILSEGINTSKLSSLETRFLNVLQELIRVTSMRYNTTIAFDEAAIYDVDQKLKGCLFSADSAMTDECYTHTQRKLALRYRLFSKKMLNQICKLYGVDCINLISSPTQLKASGDSNNFDVGPTMLLEKMTTFNAWFSSFNPSPSKIAAQWIPNYRIGTVSTDEIALDEKYLGVPQQIIMDSDKAIMKNSSVFSLIEGLFSRYKSRDDFHELMFFLIQEYFVIKEKSFYWPYLSLLPTKNDLDIPLFWSPEEVDQRLAPSQLKSVIINYQEKTRLMYEAILKIDLIASFFTKDTLSYDNYLWATAILDSRSIWWNGKRHLVPMLDFVNCKEDSVNPTRIHSTNLSPDGDYAITRAGATYGKGEQVFENYGQPNHIYFTYHGFSMFDESAYNNCVQNTSCLTSLPVQNVHDCVHTEFELDSNMINTIDWKKANPLANKLRLKREGTYKMVSCLQYPVPPQIWAFLSLAMNNFESLQERGLLGQPTKNATKFLLDIVEGKLSQYTDHSTRHESTRIFLRSEIFTLTTVKLKLQFDLDNAAASLDSSDGLSDEL